jgi:uncharacterized protein (UPF0332 family)
MKNRFFMQLAKERKLELIESSEEIKNSYLEKSESNLISAKILIKNDRLEEAVSLAYYSMYHSVLALFFNVGIKCENHSASIILLKELFGLDNTLISNAKKERIDKQYYADFKITNKIVQEAIKSSEEFNQKIFNFISVLNSEKISNFRNKFQDLIR